MLQHNLMSFALLGAEWVLWLLVALSVLCVAVAIERTISLVLNRTPDSPLRAALLAYTHSGDALGLVETLSGLRGAEARVLRAGASRAADGVGSVEEALLAASAVERSRMERFLTVLGTTGANAPFIGLFGTVLGIVRAFHDLSEQQAEAASAVMAGISEALVATAIGLLVAIPAVVVYNAFQRSKAGTLGRIESFSHLLLARLKREVPPGAEA
ncbi:MAG: MotA/TolQ/ExbB proton channel family protein [Deltaproteobacteria bacterium]|nr:MotA/TolQ/ExbB proton channel family protein [Deltaproteobacteria bacterium]